MAHFGTLRDHRFSHDVDDIRGAKLYGKDDEKLGKITDVIFEHGSGAIQYAVVDAGELDQTRLFLVPAAEIQPSGKHPNDFFLDATSDEINSLPTYNEEVLGIDPAWGDYRKKYDEAWARGPVMHKELSTHTITPEPDELPAGTGTGVDDRAYTPDRIAGVFTDTTPGANKLRMRPSGLAARAEDGRLPGAFEPEEKPTLAGEEAEQRAVDNRKRRWAAFEDHLRRNHVDITASCRSCGTARDKVA